MSLKLAYFLTHPIQYQSPLIRALHDEGVDVHVIYGPMADERTLRDEELGREQPWDIPLLEGYPFTVLESPVWYGPVGFLCLRGRIRSILTAMRPDVVWVHGWGDVYSAAAWNIAWQMGFPVMLRGESHMGCLKGGWLRRWLHHQILRRCFGTVSLFLAIGTANRAFYRCYGVPEEKICDVPYAVDNRRFAHVDPGIQGEVEEWRRSLGIGAGDKVIGFCGKLKKAKRPDLAFQAVLSASQCLPVEKQPWLLFVGDGPLRRRLEAQAEKLRPQRTHFLGFQNQSRMPALYQLMDILLLPSDFEPWGLVVNEAMCAGCAVLLSDRVGAAPDLVQGRGTGQVFDAGDFKQMAASITHFLADTEALGRAREQASKRIQQWSYREDVAGVQSAMGRLGKEAERAGRHRGGWELPVEKKVTVSYMGVHQAFQLALAAHEGGLLKRFYASVVDAPGKWGEVASLLFGAGRMVNRRSGGIDSALISENPWPLLWKLTRDRFVPSRSLDWTSICDVFDKQAASEFRKDPSLLFVGTETCALFGMAAAKECGAITMLDCPQLHPLLLERLMVEAADRAEMSVEVFIDVPGMADRKRREYEMADHLLIYSEIHRHSFVLAGFDEKRLFECPLWVDPRMWYRDSSLPVQKISLGRLKVLFVGSLSLRKGVPFLLKAFEMGKGAWDLTLVGPVSNECIPLLAKYEGRVEVLPPQTKSQLRKTYSEHDIFVLPSVVDTFGFVALEAMACGTPALVSSNCGAPVPDASWRFTPMDPAVLNAKIVAYAEDPVKVAEDSRIAEQFACQFTPARYRSSILKFYQHTLGLDSEPT